MSVQTFNPLVDAHLRYDYGAGAGQAWATLRALASSNIVDKTQLMVGNLADTGSGKWRVIRRSPMIFDTSGLAGTPTECLIRLMPFAKSNNNSNCKITTAIYNHNTIGDGDIVVGDFNVTRYTPIASSNTVPYDSFVNEAYARFILNLAGVANIDPEGVSKFAWADKLHDIDNSAPTWASGEYCGVQVYNTGAAAGKKPELDVCLYPQLNFDATRFYVQRPQAVQYNGYIYYTWVDSNGALGISRINIETKAVESHLFTDSTSLEKDAHSTPSILIRNSDHKIIVFYTGHLDTRNYMYWRVSSSAEDISSWGAENSFVGNNNAICYSQPIQLSGESNKIYLFYRTYKTTTPTCLWWAYRTSTDGGDTFGSEVKMITGVSDTTMRPYTYPISDGVSKIHFVNWTCLAGTYAADAIRYCYYYNGAIYKADGTLIAAVGSFPVAYTELDTVYTAPSGDDGALAWDIALDGDGIPRIVYSHCVDLESENYYCYARWNGSSWENHVICDAGTYVGSSSYSIIQGGACLDRMSTNIVYLSVATPNATGTVYKYTTSDGGSSWAQSSVDNEPDMQNFFPTAVEDADGSLDALWNICEPGDFELYWTFETALLGYAPGAIELAVSTEAATDVTWETATGNGTIVSLGVNAVTERGFCWNKTGDPTVDDDHTDEEGSFGEGAFDLPISNLDGGTHYYLRAYAYDGSYAYGEVVEFDTQVDPDLWTGPPGQIKATSVQGLGDINSVEDILQLGFQYKLYAEEEYTDVVYLPEVPTTPNFFYLEISGLSPSTQYKYRAVAEHAVAGWLYGNEVSFATAAPTPVIETLPPEDTSFNPAKFTARGELTDIGGSAVDQRGFVYGMTSVFSSPGNVAPAASGYEGISSEDGSFTPGEYEHVIGNLNGGKVYYVRAWAHNSYGWAYGDELRCAVSETVDLLYPNSVVSSELNGFPYASAKYKNVRTKDTEWHSNSRWGYLTGSYGWRDYWDIDIWYTDRYGLTDAIWRDTSMKLAEDISDSDLEFAVTNIEEAIKYINIKINNEVMTIASVGETTITVARPGPKVAHDAGTDIFGQREEIVKVKWKGRLFQHEYPYGYGRGRIDTHGLGYAGTIHALSPSGVNICTIYEDNPYTEVDWTIDEANDLEGGVMLNPQGSFTLVACDFIECVILRHDAEARTDKSTKFTGATARLNGYVVEDEAEACEVWFEYGPTVAYGSSTTHQDKARGDEFYADITGLDPEVSYHFRACILTACGETFYGADRFVEPEAGQLLIEQAYSIEGVRQDLFSVSPVWTDITEEVMAWSTKRGRLHELDRVETGSAIISLNNLTGNWWRYNTAGAHYPDVKPLTLTRIRYKWEGETYNLFYGYSESYNPTWRDVGRGGFVPIMEMQCVDMFKAFARFRLIDANPALSEDAAAAQSDVKVDVADLRGLVVGQHIKIYDELNEEVNQIMLINELTGTISMVTPLANTYHVDDTAKLKKFPAVLSGDRIRDCLFEIGWPSEFGALLLTSIDDGQCEVAEYTPSGGGAILLEHLFEVTEAEDGIAFMRGDGYFIFQDSSARTSSPYDTSQATFGNAANNLYVHPELLDDDTFLYNEATIKGDAIGEQGVYQPDLQAKQGPRILLRANSQLNKALDALKQAFILAYRYSDTLLRCQQLLVIPSTDPDNLYPLALGLDISTRITFNLTNTRNPAQISQEYHIEGIEHSWSARENELRTIWQLWNVNKYRAINALHDGYLLKISDISYADCHDAAEGIPENDAGIFEVGQWAIWTGAIFLSQRIERGYIELDTSSLEGLTIKEAYLLVKPFYTSQDTAWNLTLVDNQTVNTPVVEADYGELLDAVTSLGSVTISNYAWHILALNAAGIAHINKTGLTRFGIRSSRDISNTDPGQLSVEWVSIFGVGSDYAPILIVRVD